MNNCEICEVDGGCLNCEYTLSYSGNEDSCYEPTVYCAEYTESWDNGYPEISGQACTTTYMDPGQTYMCDSCTCEDNEDNQTSDCSNCYYCVDGGEANPYEATYEAEMYCTYSYSFDEYFYGYECSNDSSYADASSTCYDCTCE